MHRTGYSLKSNLHIPRRSHAVFQLYRDAVIHTCNAATLSFSDSAVSFAKVRVVAGNIRAASPTF
jgi:hypothetical protein